MLKRLRAMYAAHKHRRQWPIELQLQWLRQQVQEDARWMAHDPKVKALTDRYLTMLAPDWMSQSVQEVGNFRIAIGCDPHNRPKVIVP